MLKGNNGLCKTFSFKNFVVPMASNRTFVPATTFSTLLKKVAISKKKYLKGTAVAFVPL